MVCPICIAAPAVIAVGAVATKNGVSSQEKKEAANQLLLWSGITLIVSIIGLFVFMKFFSTCKTCRI